MPFRPLQDQIVIRRAEPEEVTSGGIIIPKTIQDKPQEGFVVITGRGSRDKTGKIVDTVVKAGDRVIFSKFAGHDIKVDGEMLIIMPESDIIGVLSPV